MNCKQAQIAIALLVGNDLPKSELILLLRHLDNCSDCAEELAQYQEDYQNITDIIKSDQPESLPSNFSYLVQESIRQIESGTKTKIPYFARSPIYITATVTAIVALFIFLISQNPIRIRKVRLDAHLKAIANIETHHPEFQWDAKLKYLENLEGPIRLDKWQASDKSGIIAIMHKPDPHNRPNTFILDYCKESRNIKSLMSYPWFNQRLNHLTIEAGSQQNIYVAFYYLPHSTRIERNRIIKKIEKKYKVNLFDRKGV